MNIRSCATLPQFPHRVYARRLHRRPLGGAIYAYIADSSRSAGVGDMCLSGKHQHLHACDITRASSDRSPTGDIQARSSTSCTRCTNGSMVYICRPVRNRKRWHNCSKRRSYRSDRSSTRYGSCSRMPSARVTLSEHSGRVGRM